MISPTNVWKLAIGVLLLGAMLLGTTLAMSAEQRPYETGPGTVPEDLKNYVIGYLTSQYGEVESVSVEGKISFSDWARIEPGLSSGLSETEKASSVPAYALLVTGSFVVEGPVGPEGVIRDKYEGGRVIFDGGGNVTSVRLWDGAPPSGELFGKEYDDQ